jgi:hypothetical protein
MSRLAARNNLDCFSACPDLGRERGAPRPLLQLALRRAAAPWSASTSCWLGPPAGGRCSEVCRRRGPACLRTQQLLALITADGRHFKANAKQAREARTGEHASDQRKMTTTGPAYRQSAHMCERRVKALRISATESDCELGTCALSTRTHPFLMKGHSIC